MRQSTFGSLDVRQYADRATLGAAASRLVADSLRRTIAASGEARAVFACAPSQNEFLAALIAETVDWSRVVVFHMDEYVGLSAAHPASFRGFLHGHLISRIAPPKAVHLIRADEDIGAECQRYGALLAEKPIDLVCMGIGENGHLAFNDPPVADFRDPQLIKPVALDAACRRQQVNDGCFPAFDAVPTHALTLTIPALVGAREISCVVPGERKALAVRATLLGPITTDCPASILRTHPRAVLHIDDAAASLLGK
jgi:glucosamine-6-phosphate deaminase